MANGEKIDATARADWTKRLHGEAENALLERDQAVSLAGTSNAPCILAVKRAQGIWLEDSLGQRYADLYGNNCHHIGYAHPRLLDALRQQLETVAFAPRGFTAEPTVALAEMLRDLWGAEAARVALTPSGSDAIETALALAKACTGRYKTISFYGAYHGRSAGALSVGGRHSDRHGLGPLLPGALHVPPFHRHGDEALGGNHEAYARRSLEAIRDAFQYERDIAAVIAEPIRNGGFAPPDWYWPEVRTLCDGHGALLIFDEVPTGLGKTGVLFNHQHYDVRPDITVVGKALGGTTLPVAGIVANGELVPPAAANVGYFTHEKNPLLACAGLTTLRIIVEGRLADRARLLHDIGMDLLNNLASRTPLVREVRGVGLMFAIEFSADTRTSRNAAAVAEVAYRACVERNVIPLFPSGASVTLSVPLIVTEAELRDALLAVSEAVLGLSNAGCAKTRPDRRAGWSGEGAPPDDSRILY